MEGRNSEIFQISFYLFDDLKISHLMTKPTKWLCAKRRLRSAWASAQSDQSSLWARWVAKDSSFLHAHREDSDQTGRMPRLICLRWAHIILLVLTCCGSNVYPFMLSGLFYPFNLGKSIFIQGMSFVHFLFFKYFDIKPCIKTIDPEHMPESAVFDLGLHCLPWCW